MVTLHCLSSISELHRGILRMTVQCCGHNGKLLQKILQFEKYQCNKNNLHLVFLHHINYLSVV